MELNLSEVPMISLKGNMVSRQRVRTTFPEVVIRENEDYRGVYRSTASGEFASL